MDRFKNKIQLALSRQIMQIKKKKEWEGISGKNRLFSKTFFTSVLTIAREKCQKSKGKILTRCVR